MSAMDADVAIVGAGLAGLSCARALADAGAKVVVLEARDRVGGRTWSQPIGRATFDVGGQWIGTMQHRAAALARELGLQTFPTHTAGANAMLLDGKLSTYTGTIPKLPIVTLIELDRALRRVDKLVAKMRAEPPWNDAELDGTTLGDFAARHIRSRTVRDLLASAVRVVFGAEPRELSMLFFLFYLRAGGGLMKLLETEGGAQEMRFTTGAQSLSSGLAARLGASVRTSAPVRSIAQDDAGVVVRFDGGDLRAKRAVVAVPPAIAARIAFEPLLPGARDQLLQRTPMGATIKLLVLYERPFWRARGMSGHFVANRGPISIAFDNTSFDAKQACLVAFVVGDDAKRWGLRRPDERRNAALAQLADVFGPEARAPEHFVEHDWCAEAWTRGCPVGLMTCGTMTAFADVWRAPVGRVHWAGTETATVWHGFLEGALESGERAAREITRLL